MSGSVCYLCACLWADSLPICRLFDAYSALVMVGEGCCMLTRTADVPLARPSPWRRFRLSAARGWLNRWP
jgi:hypothetical protein